MVEPPGFLLRVYGPLPAAGPDGHRIWVCRLRLFCLSRPIYLNMVSLLRYFPPTTAMVKKKVTGDELSARAKVNGYHRGAHRDRDSLRDENKHVARVKMHQNAMLDRYVL
jgi:hypothetical protein